MLFYKNAKEIGSSYRIDLGTAHTLRIKGDFEDALKGYDGIFKKYKSKVVIADSLTGKAL